MFNFASTAIAKALVPVEVNEGFHAVAPDDCYGSERVQSEQEPAKYQCSNLEYLKDMLMRIVIIDETRDVTASALGNTLI